MSRIARLAALLEEPLLVCGLPGMEAGQANVRYLTGLRSSNAACLVELDGSAVLYTDFRYLERARELGDGLVVEEAPRALVPALAARLRGRRVGVEAENVPYAAVSALREGGVEVVPRSGLVESLRAVKEPGEVAALRRAAALSDEVLGALLHERFSGRTEIELAWWVERAFREAGATALAFPTVVAGGRNGAIPHAESGERRIEPGWLVIVDAGCVLSGYCSDCTRTVAVGAVTPRLRELYALCLEAQLRGLEAVGPGVEGRAADAASRAPIDEAGLGHAYGHGLGHGVGLQVHEAPVLRPESNDVLEPGNVVTVEPGIYLPEEGAGVRIEDLVLVTDAGCERLTQLTTELVEVA